jgi:hypothetical protein
MKTLGLTRGVKKITALPVSPNASMKLERE